MAKCDELRDYAKELYLEYKQDNTDVHEYSLSQIADKCPIFCEERRFPKCNTCEGCNGMYKSTVGRWVHKKDKLTGFSWLDEWEGTFSDSEAKANIEKAIKDEAVSEVKTNNERYQDQRSNAKIKRKRMLTDVNKAGMNLILLQIKALEAKHKVEDDLIEPLSSYEIKFIIDAVRLSGDHLNKLDDKEPTKDYSPVFNIIKKYDSVDGSNEKQRKNNK